MGLYIIGPPMYRFWHHVTIPDDDSLCWSWDGSKNDAGYGQFMWKTGGSPRRAHRISYEYLRGPLSDRLVMDHDCRNRHCVNPWHLEEVTDKVNISRGNAPSAVRMRTGVCKRGHLYTEENTWRRPGRGDRECRTCRKTLRAAEYQRAKGCRNASGGGG